MPSEFLGLINKDELACKNQYEASKKRRNQAVKQTSNLILAIEVLATGGSDGQSRILACGACFCVVLSS